MNNAATPNANRLLWAGFLAIFAEGVGFGVRTGVLRLWDAQYGFTMTELGEITGGGLWGFGVIILLGSLLGVGVPVIHMMGKGVGGKIAQSSGGFFFVWTLLALGVTALFSVILSVRGLWSLQSGQSR